MPKDEVDASAVDLLVEEAVNEARAQSEEQQLTEEMKAVDPAVDQLVADTMQLVGGRSTRRDTYLLFAARFVRLFAFSAMTVVLLLLLDEVGIAGESVGVLLTLIMVGDLGVTFYLTAYADRLGRKRTLLLGTGLALLSAVAFGTTTSFALLLIAGTLGVVSPGGAEVGPFLAVEQAALADLGARDGAGDVAAIAATFGKYQFVGEAAKAAGSLVAGAAVEAARAGGAAELSALRAPALLFGVCALLKAALYARLSPGMEAGGGGAGGGTAEGGAPRARLCGAEVGLRPESTPTVLRLSALFALDAFGGGFAMLSFLSFWFRGRWGLQLGSLGAVLAAVNVVAGLSSMAAGLLVRRLGAVPTMVYTHCISQMDVPARQAYVAKLIDSEERSAAGGITAVARSVGLLFSPLLLGPFMAAAPGTRLFDAPFYLAGAIKIVYDVTVFYQFRKVSRAHA